MRLFDYKLIKCCFRLGVMHAIGLIMNDDLLLMNNITVGSDNLMAYIKEIQRPWHQVTVLVVLKITMLIWQK